jgi:hypothetical protein
MDVVKVLRALWTKRLLVAVIAGCSIAAGVALVVLSPQKQVGTAHAMALVDTPNSQVVDLGGEKAVASATTLSSRATLLTGLMTSSPLKDEIASRAGISAASLLAVSAATQGTDAPAGQAPSSTPASTPSAGAAHPNVLTATVPDLATGQVPLITIDTQSPTATGAAKLADSSIAVLSDYLKTLAAQDRVPGARRVIVRELGPAVASTTAQGPSKVLAVGLSILLFALGCGLILAVQALKAGWRRADELEQLTAAARSVEREPSASAASEPALDEALDGAETAASDHDSVRAVAPASALG